MLILLLVFARPAQGYIDPGTGSFLLQILIGGVLGSLLAIKMFWRRIIGFFARRFGRKRTDGGETAESASPRQEGEDA